VLLGPKEASMATPIDFWGKNSGHFNIFNLADKWDLAHLIKFGPDMCGPLSQTVLIRSQRIAKKLLWSGRFLSQKRSWYEMVNFDIIVVVLCD
jgi:hypothetical protein